MTTGDVVEGEHEQIVEQKLLLVEGKDDKGFFNALVRHLTLTGFQVMTTRGKTDYPKKLKGVAKATGFNKVISMGIVRDADDDPAATVQSIQNALKAADLPAPERSLVCAGKRPKVTFMIVPDDQTAGELEHLCLRAVEKEPATQCVELFFRCLQEQGGDMPRKPAKAKVQAFLASRVEPGKLLGQAAEAGYWPWGSKAFEQVKTFLLQL